MKRLLLCLSLLLSCMLVSAKDVPEKAQATKTAAPRLVSADLLSAALQKASIATFFQGMPASVSPTAMEGVFEVLVKTPQGAQIAYTDKEGKTFIFGSMVDATTKANLTQPKLEKLSQVVFSELPLDKAIKRVFGNGQRTLVSFEDPNCGYCKKLGAELSAVDNVTVYTFLVPILSQDSEVMAQSLWCSEKPAEAVEAWMKDGTAPKGAKHDCTFPKDEMRALFSKAGGSGTPMMVNKSGKKQMGFMPASELAKFIAN